MSLDSSRGTAGVERGGGDVGGKVWQGRGGCVVGGRTEDGACSAGGDDEWRLCGKRCAAVGAAWVPGALSAGGGARGAGGEVR